MSACFKKPPRSSADFQRLVAGVLKRLAALTRKIERVDDAVETLRVATSDSIDTKLIDEVTKELERLDAAIEAIKLGFSRFLPQPHDKSSSAKRFSNSPWPESLPTQSSEMAQITVARQGIEFFRLQRYADRRGNLRGLLNINGKQIDVPELYAEMFNILADPITGTAGAFPDEWQDNLIHWKPINTVVKKLESRRRQSIRSPGSKPYSAADFRKLVFRAREHLDRAGVNKLFVQYRDGWARIAIRRSAFEDETTQAGFAAREVDR